MSHAKDAQRFARRLEQEGYTVSIGGSGHWRVFTQEGERVATFPRTPSDRRWQQNAMADIRRWKRARGIPVGRDLLFTPYRLIPMAVSHPDPSQARRYTQCLFQ